MRFLYELWSTRFVSLKLCVGFSIFDSVWFSLKFVFVQKNAWTLWLENVIIPFKIKILQKSHRFVPRPLIFKLQQKVLKFNYICGSWISQKTVINFLNPENGSFGNVSIVIFKYILDIPLLNNLFISFLNLFVSLIEFKNIH